MSWNAKWAKWGRMNPYDIHKMFINEYILTKHGSTQLLQRDTSKDKRDIDVIRENHKFLWNEEDVVDSWEKRIAKKYYDRLFKEYCISDLTRYKEDKFGFRWRTEKELVEGKGQFSCGSRHCSEMKNLRTWEVNFKYDEHGEKKSALVKLRLCQKCSRKLNYRFKRREVKKQRIGAKNLTCHSLQSSSKNLSNDDPPVSDTDAAKAWEPSSEPEVETEDQQVDQFLRDLFF